MPRVCFRLSSALLIVFAPGAVATASAYGGHGSALTVSFYAFAAQTKGAQAGPKEKPAGANNSASDTPRQGSRRDVARLRRLHEQMTKTFNLSTSQRETIDGMFREHMQAIRDKLANARPRTGKNTGSPKLKQLRKRIAAAREAGDDSALSALRTEYRQAMTSPRTTAASSTAKFLKQVETQLSQEQRSEFRSLVRRLRVGAFPQAGQRAWRNLWRAVLNPDIGLSEEQHKIVSAMLREGRTSAKAAQSRRAGTEGESDAAPTLRDRVLAKLTPEQRTKVEAALKTMEKRRRRRPGARPQQDQPTRQDKSDGVP